MGSTCCISIAEHLLGLVHTSDGSGVVSGVGIGRKIISSDPFDSDSVELPTPLPIPLFNLHWVVTLIALPFPTPLPIPLQNQPLGTDH